MTDASSDWVPAVQKDGGNLDWRRPELLLLRQFLVEHFSTQLTVRMICDEAGLGSHRCDLSGREPIEAVWHANIVSLACRNTLGRLVEVVSRRGWQAYFDKNLKRVE